MMLTVEATIDVSGNVKILQPVSITRVRRALLVILDEPSPMIAETALLSEAALAEDWLRPEEDEAWAYLQQPAPLALSFHREGGRSPQSATFRGAG